MGQWRRKSEDELQGFSECTDWNVFVADICELCDRLTGDGSVGRASDLKARRNAEASSSPRCGKGLFCPESTSCADSFTVSVLPPGAVACIHIHPLKSQTLAVIPSFGYTKILLTLIGMGSAPLAADVPYTGRATRIPRK